MWSPRSYPLFLLLSIACVSLASSYASTPTGIPVRTSSSVLAGKTVCIAGGGPCGLFLAILLLEQEETVKIHIMERAPRNKGKPSNAFGMGLSARLLDLIHNEELEARLRSVGAKVNAFSKSFGGIASRQDICEQMVQYLEEHHNNSRFQLSFEEACEEVDLDKKTIRTSRGTILSYDLLVAADGVNSKIRRQLVEERGLQVEHFLDPKSWKALRMPSQPDLDPASFKPLLHPNLSGRILPRNPNGHIALIFFEDVDGTGNPQGVQTAQDLKHILREALSDRNKGGNMIMRNLFRFGSNKTEVNRDRQVLFDDDAIDQFLEAPAGRSHFMKIDRFHCNDSVVLLGDAAHGMSSFLGQGCACGFLGGRILAECLQQQQQQLPEASKSSKSDLQSCLEQYTKRVVTEAHAITDLNLVSYTLATKNLFYKLLFMTTLLWQAVRGKLLVPRLSQVDVSYSQLLKENHFAVTLGRRLWKKKRVPLPTKE